MKRTAIAIAFFAFSFCSSYSQENTKQSVTDATVKVTPEYRAATLRLFKAINPDDVFQDMVDGILKRVERYELGMPKSFQDSLAKSLDNTNFYDEQIQVYSEIFDLKEIQELTNYFESAVAKKMRLYSGGFMRKLGAIEDKYFSLICLELGKKIEARGFEAPPFLKPPQDIPMEESVVPEVK